MSTLPAFHNRAAERPVVVARRWDGLGGRLNAIVNGWSLARVLGAEFRFVWPNGEGAPGSAEELFAPAFLAAYEIRDAVLEHREVLPDPTEWPLERARQELGQAGSGAIVDITEYAAILGFRDEAPSVVRARFRASACEIGWNPVLSQLSSTVSAGLAEGRYTAIHVRAGDIVVGDWRQYLPIEKYTPRAYVEAAIERLAAANGGKVVIVSDNAAYAADLRARYDFVRSPAEMLEGYGELTPAQQAFADIWLLSGSERIVGPTTSAFSRLASNLAGQTLGGVQDLLARDEAQELLRRAIDRDVAAADLPDFQKPMLVRDINWYLGVFGDDVTLGDRARLTDAAVAIEPDFCGALNNQASNEAFRGNWLAARTASLRALSAAGKAHRHADPTVESLVTSFVDDVVSNAMRDRNGQLPGTRGPADGRGDRVDVEAVLRDLREQVVRCEALEPFQIHHQDVLFNLRFQLAALEWLLGQAGGANEAAMASLRTRDDEPLLDGAWRLPGVAALQAPGGYPLALRNVETVSIRLAQAIGQAVARLPRGDSRSSYCYVESISVSPSGLRWVNGWAHDSSRPGQTVLGFLMNGAFCSGGLTYLARPEIATTLNDPAAVKVGFSFPLPMDASDEFGELQSALTRVRKPRRWFGY